MKQREVMSNNPIAPSFDKAIGAVWGAACGDALGWPNERISKSKSNEHPKSVKPQFRPWEKRSGGRFYPHEDHIAAGEYSDDTQLILSLARCRLSSHNWWDNWVSIELPFWTTYERGGGGATKRAAMAWASGYSPWAMSRKPNDVLKYFQAGGNGVAMRILPHVLSAYDSKQFKPIAKDILIDGISTHGHPRALVGALAYGYALWRCLNRRSPLEYGELISELLINQAEWARRPDISIEHKEWYAQKTVLVPDYEDQWEDAVDEMHEYVQLCRDELNLGALAFDEDTLRKLGCFDRKINGSGTVGAAAAVFLASRYAPDPMNGLVQAAFSIGADTDTIASMTGALLGSVSGSAWIDSFANNLQDSRYLSELARELVQDEKNLPNQPNLEKPLKKSALKKWNDELMECADLSLVRLPDGRRGTVSLLPDQVSGNGGYKVQYRKILNDDGQSIFIKKISKIANGGSSTNLVSPSPLVLNSTKGLTVQCGIKLPVSSLKTTSKFYVSVLGLSVKKETADTIIFKEGLSLVGNILDDSSLSDFDFCALVSLVVSDLDKVYAFAKNRKTKIVTPMGTWKQSSRRFFRCLDPEGNILEVFSEHSRS